MSLDYGWAWCRAVNREEDPLNKSPEATGLTKIQRQSFANLAWLMMYTGVPEITPGTVPVILARMRILDAAGGTPLYPTFPKDSEGFLKGFLGYSTNAEAWTDQEFLKRVRQVLQDKGASMTPKVAKEARAFTDKKRRENKQYCYPRVG